MPFLLEIVDFSGFEASVEYCLCLVYRTSCSLEIGIAMVVAYSAGVATVSLLVIGGCEYRMRIARLWRGRES